MARTTAVLLSLFLSTAVFAQSADLSATVDAPDRVPPGETFTVTGTVTNLGPDPAQHVLVSLSGSREWCISDLDIGTLQPNETRTFSCQGQMPLPPLYAIDAVMWAQTATPDPRYENNVAVKRVGSITPPDLFLWAYFLDMPRPGLPVPMQVNFGNIASMEATNATLTITTSTRVTKAPDSCTITENRAVCAVGTIPAPDPSSNDNLKRLNIEVLAPDASMARLDVTVTIDAAEDDARPENDQYSTFARTYRTFNVTTVADNGSGSLRAAMEAANAECVDADPCLIAFRIPRNGDAPWHTIAVTSPLPRVVLPVLIDGTTQAAYFGDTNAAGPEIELTGVSLRDGSGIELACSGGLRGLAINGFPANGVLLTDSGCKPAALQSRIIDGNTIGTDPTGTRAVPNFRGVWVTASGWAIRNNIISGNTASGVFIASGKAKVTENKIFSNGASGVGILRNGSGSDVTGNSIAFNGHFGVAIAPDAIRVSADRNSIYGNHQRGIDWGIDGVTTVSPVKLPEITSVRVENGTTIIEGTHDAFGTFAPFITIYANDAPDPSGYGEGQTVLGTVNPNRREWQSVYQGDLRGKWVTATATHVLYIGWVRDDTVKPNDDRGDYFTTTSEFSRAVEVK